MSSCFLISRLICIGKSVKGDDIVRCYCQWNACNVKAIVQEYLNEFNANTTTTTTAENLDEFNGAGQIMATFALITLGLVMAGMVL